MNITGYIISGEVPGVPGTAVSPVKLTPDRSLRIGTDPEMEIWLKEDHNVAVHHATITLSGEKIEVANKSNKRTELIDKELIDPDPIPNESSAYWSAEDQYLLIGDYRLTLEDQEPPEWSAVIWDGRTIQGYNLNLDGNFIAILEENMPPGLGSKIELGIGKFGLIETEPILSRDRQKLVFSAGSNIYVADFSPPGEQRARLNEIATNVGEHVEFDISPDGNWVVIIFRSTKNQFYNIITRNFEEQETGDRVSVVSSDGKTWWKNDVDWNQYWRDYNWNRVQIDLSKQRRFFPRWSPQDESTVFAYCGTKPKFKYGMIIFSDDELSGNRIEQIILAKSEVEDGSRFLRAEKIAPFQFPIDSDQLNTPDHLSPLLFGSHWRLDSRFYWSPDGSHIAYLNEDSLSLIRIEENHNTEPIEIYQLLQNEFISKRIVKAGWSPKGKRIALLVSQTTVFFSDYLSNIKVITIINPDKDDLDEYNIAIPHGGIIELAWSENEKKIGLIHVSEGDDEEDVLFVVEDGVPGGNLQVVAKMAYIREAKWAKDGQKIAFVGIKESLVNQFQPKRRKLYQAQLDADGQWKLDEKPLSKELSGKFAEFELLAWTFNN